nr:fimbrial assembly chaperone [Salmonella sp. NCTC 7297]
MKHIKRSMLVVLLASHVAHASIVVGGTRLVFDGNNDESSINVENKDSKANLVQSWLSVADPQVTNKQAFIITRLFFALMPGKRTVFGLFDLAHPCLQIGSLCTGSILRYPFY